MLRDNVFSLPSYYTRTDIELSSTCADEINFVVTIVCLLYFCMNVCTTCTPAFHISKHARG